ncbi:CrcB family protein [Dactylosporangium sp. NPDC000244]|uniref:fluoride efflux transporter FluC n=1 Tax=Dactylosporangium sp. NPDC000244 TaxID=3154365 RepID=UPI00331801B0
MTEIDPDIDVHVPAQRLELRPSPWPVLGAISAGGVCGALARFGLAQAWPHARGGFPWSTLVVNVTGCLLIGALMVIVTEVATERRLLRPFAGVGVLGGYTTFSTYAVEIHQTASAGSPWAALTYLAVTVVGALIAVWTGSAATHALVRRLGRNP